MTVRMRLLPALLLALAGCSIAASPSDLAPKTDAECAASGKKACGYKCVGPDDPATGCGEPGCSPCDARGVVLGPHTAGACTTLNECGYVCDAGWSDCNGDPVADGCETPVENDPANCGACKRSCGNALCIGGGCTAEALETATVGEPRGIVTDATSVYWVVAGSGGRAYRWDLYSGDPTFTLGRAIQLASGLDPADTGAVFRLARDGGKLFASGAAGLTSDLAIFPIDPTMIGTAPLPLFTRSSSTADAVLGLAGAGGLVFFSTTADPGVHWIMGPATEGSVVTASAVRGLTALDRGVLFGQGGGAVGAESAISWLSATDFGVSAYVATPGSWASRIALFPDATSPTHVFWADESSGAVHALNAAVIYTLDTGDQLQAEMDLAADAWGVVWSSSKGIVRAWRAEDGAVFDLPTRGGTPRGVALTPTHVYWTEGGTSPAVLRVPK